MSWTDWFRRCFVDGADWVMNATVIGMSQYADLGRVDTRAYAVDGGHIDEISDYCGGCRYEPTRAGRAGLPVHRRVRGVPAPQGEAGRRPPARRRAGRAGRPRAPGGRAGPGGEAGRHARPDPPPPPGASSNSRATPGAAGPSAGTGRRTRRTGGAGGPSGCSAGTSSRPYEPAGAGRAGPAASPTSRSAPGPGAAATPRRITSAARRRVDGQQLLELRAAGLVSSAGDAAADPGVSRDAGADAARDAPR